MDKHSKDIEAARLRRTAEQLAKWTMVHPMQTESDAKKLLHELQVHHIELELQNAELQVHQTKLELQNAELQFAHTEMVAALKKVTELNESLNKTFNVIDAIRNTNESNKRALQSSITNQILKPLNLIKKMTGQMKLSEIDSNLLEEIDSLEVSSLEILKSINSF